MITFDNPLAESRPDRPDIESGKSLMPPLPNITVDRMLRRAADRIGGKVRLGMIVPPQEARCRRVIVLGTGPF